jgi:hypothetical protein
MGASFLNHRIAPLSFWESAGMSAKREVRGEGKRSMIFPAPLAHPIVTDALFELIS